MAWIRVRAEEISYPAVILRDDRFVVWRDVRSARVIARGLLVSSAGQAYPIVNAEASSIGKWWSLKRRPRTITFVCDREPFTFSVDDIRRKLDRIAWRVSASGHFESPAGFGTRYSLARISCADSVAELLAILVESEC